MERKKKNNQLKKYIYPTLKRDLACYISDFKLISWVLGGYFIMGGGGDELISLYLGVC